MLSPQPHAKTERLATVHDITAARILARDVMLRGTLMPRFDPNARLDAEDIAAIFRLLDTVHTQAAIRSATLITPKQLDQADRIVELLTGRSADNPSVYFQLHASIVGLLMAPAASNAEFSAFHPLLRLLGEHNVAQYARLGIHPKEGPLMRRVIESYHRLIAAFRSGDPALVARVLPAHHAIVANNTLTLLRT